MSLDLNINIDKMLVLALRNKETFCEEADLVIEEDENQLDFPPQEIAQKSRSHLYFSIQIPQSSDLF